MHKNKEDYTYDEEGRIVGEVGGRPKITDQGYMPNSEKIKQMIAAGERLSEAQKGNFDYPLGDVDIEDELEDISRIKNVEFHEVVEAQKKAIERIKKKREEIHRERKQEIEDKRKEIMRREIYKEIDERKGSPPDVVKDIRESEGAESPLRHLIKEKRKNNIKDVKTNE